MRWLMDRVLPMGGVFIGGVLWLASLRRGFEGADLADRVHYNDVRNTVAFSMHSSRFGR